MARRFGDVRVLSRGLDVSAGDKHSDGDVIGAHDGLWAVVNNRAGLA